MTEDFKLDGAPPPKAYTSGGNPKRKLGKPNGYAAPPGTGPAGKFCRDCKNYYVRGGYSKNHRKCYLRKSTWTNSYGTDIKASSPACKKFEDRA